MTEKITRARRTKAKPRVRVELTNIDGYFKNQLREFSIIGQYMRGASAISFLISFSVLILALFCLFG